MGSDRTARISRRRSDQEDGMLTRRHSAPAHSPTQDLTRRDLLCRCGMGMGALGLMQLLSSERLVTAADQSRSPLTPRQPHFPAKAKRVIHLFMNGGPSHVDTFDPKPLLARYAGRELPRANLRTERRTGAAFPSPFRFQKYGQSGI